MGGGPLFFFPEASRSIKRFSNRRGFTLIELLIAIVIMGVMASLIFLILNPVTQLNKAKDAQREQDFRQIVNALDTYYNDHNYFPATLSFGSSWVPYMQKIPQDPDCIQYGTCYGYLANSANSQWNVLFGKISNITNIAIPCPLTQMSNCLPINYGSRGYNFCVVSGKVGASECSYISTNSVP